MTRILVIEDDPDFRAVVAVALEPVGEAVIAPDAYQGLAYLRGEAFDVILLDLMLPGASGLDLLERLQELAVGTPVVVMTGAGLGPLVDRAQEHGVAQVLHKPFGVEELLAAVRAVAPEASAEG